MNTKTIFFKLVSIAVVALSMMLLTTASYAAGQVGILPYEWRLSLGGNLCKGQTFTSCHVSSPVLVDIDGDSFLDVVIATNHGHVAVVNHQGKLLWNVDIAPVFGMEPNTHEIHSSPAVADINGDGKMEIAIGVGTSDPEECTQGGVLLLDHNGNVVPGWPVLGADDVTPPVNCTDSYTATPTLGDLDNDGMLEIVIGGLDKRLLALRYDGTLMPGFPARSYHSEELKDWENLQMHFADTIHSSPALADVDGDGYLDIIIGTDEGNMDYDFHAPWTWTCGYRLPAGWAVNYCGGSLYVIDRFGRRLPGFPKYIHEIISSSPVSYDLDKDGSPEIISSTGAFYYDNSPDKPSDGFRVHIWTATGGEFAGWEGGQPTDGPMEASPSIGDITGDDDPEIVAMSRYGSLYAWHIDGTVVEGFPIQPLDHHTTKGVFGIGTSAVLADVDNDGKMEIILNIGWGTTMINGDGTPITSNHFPTRDFPIYYSEQLLVNTPVVGDMDNDGDLELVTFNDNLMMWQIANAGSKADWPMFHRDAKRQGSVPAVRKPRFSAKFEPIYLEHDPRSANPIVERYVSIEIANVVSYELDVKSSNPVVEVTTNELGRSVISKSIRLRVDTSLLPKGKNELGTLEITALAKVDADSEGVPLSATIPISLDISNFNFVYLPMVLR